MSQLKKASQRIREMIPITQVLADYGYGVVASEGNQEQQFSCDLHGDGSDNKPSARAYPSGNNFFCFACGVSRDAIALVREKEGCSFWEAIRRLEKQYGLPPIPWETEEVEETKKPSLASVVEASLKPTETPEAVLARLNRFLQGLSQERALGAQRLAGYWEATDRVSHYLSEGGDATKAVHLYRTILDKVKDALREEAG